jgi:hypothetical protein
MCLGAAKMVLETGEHPALLKDAVTTPAGCTIDGLLTLEEGGLPGDAASRRSWSRRARSQPSPASVSARVALRRCATADDFTAQASAYARARPGYPRRSSTA